MSNFVEILKKPVRRFQRTHSYYELVRKKYFNKHPIYNIPQNASPELREFLETGVVILRDFHDSQLIEEISAKSLELMKRVKAGGEESFADTVLYRDDGIYRLRDIEKHIPEAGPIVNNAFLSQLATSYLDQPIKQVANYLDYKPDIGIHDDTTVPHMDQWKSSVKIFTLFSEVTTKTAPLVYWKRSHLDKEWRRQLDYLNWLGTDIGSSGICPPHMLRERCDIEADDCLEKVTVTGKPGTVVVADTRGFHRASNVFSGYRLEVVQKYTVDFYDTFLQTLFNK